MFRHTETNIKWMLTISLLFHLTFLSIIFSSGIFKSSDLFTARHSPFSSIQVSIVNLPDDNPPVMSAPAPGKSTIEKTVQGEGVGPLLIRRQGLLQGIPWSAVLLWICLLLNMTIILG